MQVFIENSLPQNPTNHYNRLTLFRLMEIKKFAYLSTSELRCMFSCFPPYSEGSENQEAGASGSKPEIAVCKD